MASQMKSHGFFVVHLHILSRLLFGSGGELDGGQSARCFIALRLQIYRSLDLTFARKKFFRPPQADK
jgi:hypothetical protein